MRFFFFGCWNRDNCDRNLPDYRAKVLQHLQDHRENFTFGIVAGDNVYPQITTSNSGGKTKKYKKSTVDSGFSMLAKIGVPVYIGVGNHDVASEDIILYERDATFVRPNIALCHSCRFIRGKANFLFIDTNGENYHERVLGALRKDLWNIVIGHEPLIEYKKNKPSHLTSESANKLIEILSKYPKVVYLCADVHNFQAMTLPSGIPVIVSGTGGGLPDPLAAHPELLETAEPYGFCDISVSDTKITVRYNQVAGSSCGVYEVIIHENGRMTRAPPRKGNCDSTAPVKRCIRNVDSDNLLVKKAG